VAFVAGKLLVLLQLAVFVVVLLKLVCLKGRATEAGATCVIQPGGSMRDDEVIAAANAHNLAMVLTGVRHFRH
jgi:hypothetical protein